MNRRRESILLLLCGWQLLMQVERAKTAGQVVVGSSAAETRTLMMTSADENDSNSIDG